MLWARVRGETPHLDNVFDPTQTLTQTRNQTQHVRLGMEFDAWNKLKDVGSGRFSMDMEHVATPKTEHSQPVRTNATGTRGRGGGMSRNPCPHPAVFGFPSRASMLLMLLSKEDQRFRRQLASTDGFSSCSSSSSLVDSVQEHDLVFL